MQQDNVYMKSNQTKHWLAPQHKYRNKKTTHIAAYIIDNEHEGARDYLYIHENFQHVY